MSDIFFKGHNNVHLKVVCEPAISSELNDHFSFEAPNAKFSPLYRNKMWDGKIRLYHMLTGTIYCGLKQYIEHFAEVNNYTYSYGETFEEFGENVTRTNIQEFCSKLNISLPGNSSIYDYQIDAVYQAISSGRKLLLSPTASGKSAIIYCLARWHNLHKRKQLIIVPTTSLVEQLYSDFQSYSQYNNWNVDLKCSKIYSGFEKSNKSPIVISTWQSIFNLPKTFFSEFDVLYGDEAHLFKAKSLTSIMEKCTNTPYRIGTTGSLDGKNVHKLVLEGVFGPVYKVTTTRELMDSNQLASLKIYSITLEYDDKYKKALASEFKKKDNKKKKYQIEVDFLIQHTPRNKFIRNLALDQTGNTLVLYQYVEKHGAVLHDMMTKKDPNRTIFFVHGGTDTDQREQIRKITETKNDAIIVASYGTFSTGINIRNLHNIIFASPSKSRVRNLQSIGRGLRRSDSKTTCKLYDISDDLSWYGKYNYTLQGMTERIKIYNEEQFDYHMVKVQL